MDTNNENILFDQTNRELRQENAELRDQVYNLTLYLKNCFDNIRIGLNDKEDRYYKACEKKYDGLPGYNPSILEFSERND